ncbi:MAG: ABC transporter ATP-binding protein [Oligoflexia bacterium]|nr:ABC transporter ATP-binding protein [Oligoflexia bacterium]
MTPSSPQASAEQPILRVRGLKTFFHSEDGVVKAVNDVSFDIRRGQSLGLVGESGSGKSVTSLTIMRLLPDTGVSVEGGSVSLLGRDLLTVSSAEMRTVRGNKIAMIFQEPMTSLNPVFTVGDQVMEAILTHEKVDQREALKRTLALFDEVGIPDPKRRVNTYPHEMSGGQKQRVMIAMALACNPQVLIADEPTTALDVTIQAQILDLLRKLRNDRGMSILFITHDLGVIAEIADEVAVMYRGNLVEYGDVVSIFANPQHPYTKGLLACRPRLDSPYRILPTVSDFLDTRQVNGEWTLTEKEMTPERERALIEGGREKLTEPTGKPLLSVKDLQVWFPIKKGLLGRTVDHVKAVDGISFDVYKGQTLGLVGESGCGKTTTGRAILRLVEPTGGHVEFMGKDLGSLHGGDMRTVREDLQIIFQDPYSSLNPRLTVEQAVTEPMKVHGIGDSDQDRRDRAAALMKEVGLLPEHLRRYPHEFSGGQRQRICIARTLSLQPGFVICDECVSALDVSVQAQVLNLLNDLQQRRGLTYIFISHDLSVVKFMSDIMCVMQDGKIVEAGPSEAIYENPQMEYTRTLINAIPRDDIDHIRARQVEREAATAHRLALADKHQATPVT